MANASNDLKDFTQRIRDVLGATASQESLRPLAEKAVELIVKRTRLGYGVPEGTNGTAERFPLPDLSPKYVERRKKARQLSDTTAANKSNLTFTGQLLDSIAVIEIRQGSVVIGPTGTRRDGLSNRKVATVVAGKGRSFLSLSRLEAEQLTRFYRNTFGDLLRNRRLT